MNTSYLRNGMDLDKPKEAKFYDFKPRPNRESIKIYDDMNIYMKNLYKIEQPENSFKPWMDVTLNNKVPICDDRLINKYGKFKGENYIANSLIAFSTNRL